MQLGQCHQDGRVGWCDGFDGEGLEEARGEVLVTQFPGEAQRSGQKGMLVDSTNGIRPEPQEGRDIVDPSRAYPLVGGVEREQVVQGAGWIALGLYRECACVWPDDRRYQRSIVLPQLPMYPVYSVS